MSYEDFIGSKTRKVGLFGFDIDHSSISGVLFPFQRSIVQWACKRGRAAIFADCGMGKTAMQLEWLRIMSGDGIGLVVAPLSVAQQTIREAENLLGIKVTFVRSPSEIGSAGIYATNYEHVEKFAGFEFAAVVLDESSILKNSSGRQRGQIIDAFGCVPYRLACTATPSPNDSEELTNHSEFLGVANRVEVLANFFVHDEDGWRMKGHARESFFDWVASWAVSVRKPSDLGYEDSGFELPPLNVESIVVKSPREAGLLFGSELSGVTGRSKERKSTADSRIKAAVSRINDTHGQMIAWCGLNLESERIAKEVDGAVEITGSHSPEEKESRILGFIRGDYRVLVTKPRICGFGLNLQCASSMVFVGIDDSYEKFYQSVRRSYRFGQKNPVNVWIVHSEAEGAVVENVMRKEHESMRLASELVERCAATSDISKGSVHYSEGHHIAPTWERIGGKKWDLIHGDCIQAMEKMDPHSIDFSIFSPPFSSLFTYSDSPHDMGNCDGLDEFRQHFRFFPERLLRITKPGRLCAMHVAQVTSSKAMDGVIAIKDFRGLCIQEMKRGGWIHHGEITVDKCPQAQAIRTKSKSLLFVQKERDSSWLRPALADYVLLFRAPGDNAVPIQNDDVTREDWIEWARPVWYSIRESNTLNAAMARSEKDERHVCPLQLDLIHRAVMLWSNQGELVFSPFAGIGSEGYQSIKDGRRFLGVELKPEYYRVACRNLDKAEDESGQLSLFDLMAENVK